MVAWPNLGRVAGIAVIRKNHKDDYSKCENWNHVRIENPLLTRELNLQVVKGSLMLSLKFMIWYDFITRIFGHIFMFLIWREQIRSVRRDREPPEGGKGDEVYSLENILQDLLNFSADRLCLGGRLVYWIPIIRQEYKVKI